MAVARYDEETFELMGPGHSYASLTDKISSIVLTRPVSKGWLASAGLAAMVAGLMVAAVTAVIFFGVGLWGNNNTVSWAWDIINFVWWIGIGHAGTLISAILLLL